MNFLKDKKKMYLFLYILLQTIVVNGIIPKYIGYGIFLINFIAYLFGYFDEIEFLILGIFQSIEYITILSQITVIVKMTILYYTKRLDFDRNNTRFQFINKYLIFFVIYAIFSSCLNFFMGASVLNTLLSIITFMLNFGVIFLLLGKKKLSLESFFENYEFLIMGQTIPVVITMIRLHTIHSGDPFTGILFSAHYFAIFLCFFIFMLFKHKKDMSLTRFLIELAISSFLLYLTDGKHIYIIFILVSLIYFIMSKIRFLQKNKVAKFYFSFIVIIYAAVMILTGSGFQQNYGQAIKKDSHYVYLYLYKEPFNTKFDYYASTIKDKLTGVHLIFGYGLGEYGSRAANFRAYNVMAKTNFSNAELGKFFKPYVSKAYSDEANKYNNAFINYIPYMSAVLSYPFNSFISLFAETGLIGLILFVLLFNSIGEAFNVKHNVIPILFFLTIMFFDNYLEISNVSVAFFLVMLYLLRYDTNNKSI